MIESISPGFVKVVIITSGDLLVAVKLGVFKSFERRGRHRNIKLSFYINYIHEAMEPWFPSKKHIVFDSRQILYLFGRPTVQTQIE